MTILHFAKRESGERKLRLKLSAYPGIEFDHEVVFAGKRLRCDLALGVNPGPVYYACTYHPDDMLACALGAIEWDWPTRLQPEEIAWCVEEVAKCNTVRCSECWCFKRADAEACTTCITAADLERFLATLRGAA